MTDAPIELVPPDPGWPALFAAEREAIAAAAALQYQHAPYQADVMHWFCKPSPQHRTHHLHLVPLGSPLWQARLAFRDALRANLALRDAYAALKQSLAVTHRHDRDAYTAAKGPFIAQAIAQAAGRPR